MILNFAAVYGPNGQSDSYTVSLVISEVLYCQSGESYLTLETDLNFFEFPK